MKKRALVAGAGGFIGGHMACRLIKDGYNVTSVDIKQPEFRDIQPGETFIRDDLRDPYFTKAIVADGFDCVFQYAALMGGMGFISGDNDADIQHDSCLINLNMLDGIAACSVKPKIFYASSACVYPERNQLDPNNPVCSESSAYPAAPDSEYGWEKLFSERLYKSYQRNKGVDVRIARFHNIFGEFGTYDGGKEKAPAAMCRKVAQAPDGGEIEVWGDGKQTRSFLHVDECVEGVLRLMRSDYSDPLNIGSDELVTINQLADMVIKISGKKLEVKHVKGAQGVRGRCSDNLLIDQVLGWRPKRKLVDGLETTFRWINGKVNP